MSRFELVRVYLKEHTHPQPNKAGQYVFPSPTGESSIIYYDPCDYAHGGSFYRLRIEHRNRTLMIPPYVASSGLYCMELANYGPWSFDGRYAIFHEAPSWWKNADGQHRGVSARSWCVDVSDQAIEEWYRSRETPDHYRFFTPRNGGVWSPTDYRVLRSTDNTLCVGDAFKHESVAFERVPSVADSATNNFHYYDSRDIGWLTSGQIVWSGYCEPQKGIVIHYRFAFYDSTTGKFIEELRVRSDMIEGGLRHIEPPLPPRQRLYCRGIWVEIIEK